MGQEAKPPRSPGELEAFLFFLTIRESTGLSDLKPEDRISTYLDSGLESGAESLLSLLTAFNFSSRFNLLKS